MAELRDDITALWEAVEWNWFRKLTQQVLYWHWSPNFQWAINLPLRGFNETQIVYLLALSSPTEAIPASLYDNGWAGGNYINNRSFYGYPIFCGPDYGGPLFFAHYSYLGFDPRYVRDAYANYFLRNKHHALIHREYAIENPQGHAGYSIESWGLTASDNPFGYLAHEPGGSRDNGTVTPTAALASMPYTPRESMQALKHFYRDLGADLWGPMGFYDAFNLDENWFASSYLAIDQGPIVLMIENHRTGLLWDQFMANPEIGTGLSRAGFVADSTTVGRDRPLAAELSWQVQHRPAGPDRIEVVLEQAGQLSLRLRDLAGRNLAELQPTEKFPAGPQHWLLPENLPTGLYLLQLECNEKTETRKWLKTR
jgi:hypothetical protein